MSENTVDEEFCRKLPKVELHAHLNGSVTHQTIKKLIEQRRKNGHTISDDSNNFSNFKGWRVFEIFKIIHNLVDDNASVQLATREVIQEFAEDGVIYLELRSTPRGNKETGMTKRSYIETVLGVIEEVHEQNIGIMVRFLLAIDRRQSLEEAYDTLKLAAEYKAKSNGLVVGVDLSGDARVGDASDFIHVLKSAKSQGLSTAVHAAEVPNPKEVQALLGIPPDRIGHGTYLHPDDGGTQELVDTVCAKKIPIEICLTSNLICETASSVDEHHLRHWYKLGHPIAISTDDKGVFNTTLSNEYFILARSFGLTKDDVFALSQQTIDYTFTTDDEKCHLRKLWDERKSILTANF